MAKSKPPRRHVRKRIRKPIERDDQLVKACKEINLYWDVEARLARYEGAAGAVLQEAGLPMEDDVYRYQSDKSPPWRRFDVNKKIDGHFMRLVELVEAHGYDRESREGYAARVIRLAWQIRDARSRGKPDEALILAIKLGELLMEAWMHAWWDKGGAFKPGKKPGALTNAIDGGLSLHGHDAPAKLIERYVRQSDPDLLVDVMSHTFATRVSERRKKLREANS